MTPEELNDIEKAYRTLALAIVEHAAKEFMFLIRRQRIRCRWTNARKTRTPTFKEDGEELMRILRFFRGDSFQVFTTLDPEWLIRRLLEEVNK